MCVCVYISIYIYIYLYTRNGKQKSIVVQNKIVNKKKKAGLNADSFAVSNSLGLGLNQSKRADKMNEQK